MRFTRARASVLPGSVLHRISAFINRMSEYRKTKKSLLRKPFPPISISHFFILTPDCRIVLYRDTNSGVKFTSGPSGSSFTSYLPSTIGSQVEEYGEPQRKLLVLRSSVCSYT